MKFRINNKKKIRLSTGFQDSWILGQDKLQYVQLWHLN